jgi:predicted nucleic acid-binding protein
MEINSRFIKLTLILIAAGIWVLVFQNAGIIPQVKPQRIAVDSALNVTGSVDVDNTVFIKGSVDANIESINGYSKFYKDPRTGEYYVLPVTDPYQ